MPNPFEYGGIVEERAFCNRREELDDLRRAAENGDRLLVYAERRMGKTSLVRRMTSRLPPEEYLPIYVDLWATQGAESMAQAVAQAVTEAAATRAEQMLETARALFSRLVPSLTVDPTSGQPRVEFGVEATGSAGKDAVPSLKEALDSPERLAEREAARRVVVVYDEVQQLAAFDSPQAERLLRSRVQMHQDVAYLFLGSRKHLIRQMFMEEKRPLYQAAGHYPIGPIATEHWRPFIRERFTEGERPIEDAVIDELCERTGGHPYYTQHLAHDLWEVTPRGEPAARGCLQKAEDLLLRRLGHTYTVLWESLTKNQQALLRGLAAEGPEAQPFSAEFLGARGFAASSAHRAAEALLERDVIDKEAGGYLITDRFLSVWLARA
jgi:hypothetical protein